MDVFGGQVRCVVLGGLGVFENADNLHYVK